MNIENHIKQNCCPKCGKQNPKVKFGNQLLQEEDWFICDETISTQFFGLIKIKCNELLVCDDNIAQVDSYMINPKNQLKLF